MKPLYLGCRKKKLQTKAINKNIEKLYELKDFWEELFGRISQVKEVIKEQNSTQS